jgi:hypothetical protein
MILGLRWYGPVAVVVFVASVVLMLLKKDPFYHHFYAFAWYSYICLADALVHRWRGRSLLSNYFGEFLLMLPLSFLIWEMFEGFNLRLENWHYEKDVGGRFIGVSRSVWNYPLYFISFATVLPGEFLTLELARIWSERRNNWLNRAPTQPWPLTQRKLVAFQLIGWLCVALPLLWPRVCFPLIWLSMFFLIDPINWRAGRPSILRELASGRGALFCQILLAGVICGGFWELWNSWAGTKWIYTVPAPFDRLKVFEMPILGYFGFPPFALECYALYHFLRDVPGVRRLARRRSMFAFES